MAEKTKTWKKLGMIMPLVAIGLWVFGQPDGASGVTIELAGISSPAGDYRWRDVADQIYSADYRGNYDYTQAEVEVAFDDVGAALYGTLAATNLKPNFAYQLKLVGTPGTSANERLGLAGRWWQEEWNGSTWSNGQNLNDKGNGFSPNPNDQVYFSRRYTADPTSPTGYRYRYTGYLVFDYFITDGAGEALVNFETLSSYHVLWKTSQRAHSADDGAIRSATFDADESAAYDDMGGDDYPSQTVGVFGEWERLPMGGVYLQPGGYLAQIILTEESFHGSGGSYAGNWAGAMGADIQFFITCHSDLDRDGDVDGTDLAEYIHDDGGVSLVDFATNFGESACF